MKISFKYAILAPIVGGIVLVGIMVFGSIAAGAISWASRSAAPTEPEVCAHLEQMGVTVPECPAWLEGSQEVFGEYYDNRLRCYMAATDVDTVKGCDEPIQYMSDSWNG